MTGAAGLRGRLAVRALLAAAAAATALAVAAEFAIVRPVETREDVRLRSLADGLAAQVAARGTAEFRAAAPSWVSTERREWAALRAADGTVLASQGEVPARAVGVATPGRVMVAEGLRPGGYRVAASVAAAGGSPPTVVVVGFPREPLLEAAARLRGTVLGAAALAVVLVAAGAWVGAGAVLQPLRRMTEEARRAGSTRAATLPVRDPGDEFDDLARVLNDLWARLGAALEEERRFASDAAHEFRSPLAVLRLRVDRALIDGSDAALREALVAIREDCDRLGRLVQALLESSRAADASGLRVAAVSDAGEVCRSLEPDLRSLAEAGGRRLEAAIPDSPLPVLAPREVVETCLSVLVDNGLRYGAPGGTVRLEVVGLPRGGAAIRVADDGPGVDVAEAPRIFDRLFRGAAGRAGAGGFGLGLSLARRLARGVGGDLVLENPGVPGACFRVELPGSEPAGAAES